MTIRITSSEAAVAATPYLLGFTPTDSLVLLFSDPASTRGTLRVDLPDDHDPAWLASVLVSFPAPLPGTVVLMVFADTVPEQFGQAIGDWVMGTLSPVMDVIDVVVVHDGRAKSLTGPSQGVPVEELESHEVVLQCITEGMSKMPDRSSLGEVLAYRDDAMTEAVQRALTERDSWDGPYDQHRDALERDALHALRARGDLRAGDIAQIGLACQDVYVRDPLIAQLLDEPSALHAVRDRLTYSVAHLPDDLAGPTAATLALLSWCCGDGAFAFVAADRAVEADPGNSLGPLVIDALRHGLPPDTWSLVTQDIPMDVLRGQIRRSA